MEVARIVTPEIDVTAQAPPVHTLTAAAATEYRAAAGALSVTCRPDWRMPAGLFARSFPVRRVVCWSGWCLDCRGQVQEERLAAFRLVRRGFRLVRRGRPSPSAGRDRRHPERPVLQERPMIRERPAQDRPAQDRPAVAHREVVQRGAARRFGAGSPGTPSAQRSRSAAAQPRLRAPPNHPARSRSLLSQEPRRRGWRQHPSASHSSPSPGTTRARAVRLGRVRSR